MQTVFHRWVALMLMAIASWQAGECDGSIGRAIRKAAGAVEDAPVTARSSSRQHPLDDAFETSLQKASRYGDGTPGRIPHVGSRLDSIDNATLSPAQRRKAETLLTGAEDLKASMPDAIARTDLMKRHGAAALEVAGLRKGGVNDAIFTDAYLRRADVRLPGHRAATMDDLAAIAADETHWKFWNRYVRPHYGKWATGAALSSYLLFPNKWHDAAGEVTEWGIEQAGDLGGAVLEGLLRGSREAGTRIVDGVTSEISESLRPTNLLGSTVGLPLVLVFGGLVVVLLFAPLRRPTLRVIKRLVVGGSRRDDQTGADT